MWTVSWSTLQRLGFGYINQTSKRDGRRYEQATKTVCCTSLSECFWYVNAYDMIITKSSVIFQSECIILFFPHLQYVGWTPISNWFKVFEIQLVFYIALPRSNCKFLGGSQSFSTAPDRVDLQVAFNNVFKMCLMICISIGRTKPIAIPFVKKNILHIIFIFWVNLNFHTLCLLSGVYASKGLSDPWNEMVI